jgi:hypothetical protein
MHFACNGIQEISLLSAGALLREGDKSIEHGAESIVCFPHHVPGRST